MLDNALALAARGFNVFPLQPGGKLPVEDFWQHMASTNAEHIRATWNKPGYENCNVGVCTTGMVVVDIDVKNGKPGYESYTTLGGHYDTFAVRSPSGGCHCYFYGPDSGLRVDFVPGLDIRSHNGYVVGPGSVIDGVAYSLLCDRPLAPVPETIRPYLREPTTRTAVALVELDATPAVATATAWLMHEAPAVEGMGGDQHTYRTAARLVRDFALSPEMAFTLLERYWNERCLPPWNRDELWGKVQNATGYATGTPGSALPAFHFSQVALPQEAAPVSSLPSPSAIGIALGNLPELTALEPRPWAIHKFAMTGDVTVIGGAGAAGKSVLLLTAAAHFANGKDFGPWKLYTPGRAMRSVIFNAEDDLQEQGKRFAAICQAYGFNYADTKSRVAVFSDRECELKFAYLDSRREMRCYEPGMEFAFSVLKDAKADLFMADPVVNLHDLDENNPVHMRFFVQQMKRLARCTDTAIILAAHTTKSNDHEATDVNKIRGSGALVGASRIALMLSNVSQDEASAMHIPAEDMTRYARIDDGKQTYGLKSGRALAYLRMSSVKLHTLDEVGVPVLVSQQEVKDRYETARVRLGFMLAAAMKQANTASATIRNAGILLAQHDDLFLKMPHASRALELRRILAQPLHTDEGTLRLDAATAGVVLS